MDENLMFLLLLPFTGSHAGDLLVAIGHEGKAKQITGSDFIKRHHLPSSSSVQKAAQILVDKQLITHHEGTYEIYDKFMAEWMRT